MPAILRRDEPVPPRGILCSHPDRAARFSAELLSQTRVIADYRGYRVYAGSYRGHEVFVAYVGIGAPSAAILIEELIAMGAGTILRVGTNDNPSEDENDRAIAVIEESLGTRALTGAGSERPDPALLRAIQNTARRLQIPVAVRRALHIDWYYPFLRPERFSDRPARVRAWIARAAERGAEVRDMESAALFYLGRIRGVRTASLLHTILRHSVTREYADPRDKATERLCGILALETLIAEEGK